MQHPKKGLELPRRWAREEPLYQVSAEYHCDQTFASAVQEMLYVQGKNTVFHSNVMTEIELQLFRLTECV